MAEAAPNLPAPKTDTPPVAPTPAPRRTRLVLENVPKRGLIKRAFLLLLFLGVMGLGGGSIVAVAFYAKYSVGLPKLPSVRDYRPPILTEFWSSDRVLAGEFYDERRRVVPYERIPKKLVQAFIAAEDERFFDHPGFDPIGTARAAWKTFVVRHKVQGGSSLTQQAAKAVLVSVELSKITDDDLRAEVLRRLGAKRMAEDPDAVRLETLKVHAAMKRAAHARATEKTIRRKVRELILALRLEKALHKEEILYLYLNNVYLGHHSYGVQSAAENYFRKDVTQLTLAEMALLAGLPQAPSRYSPFANPEEAKRRRQYVLNRMATEGMISEAEKKAAEAQEVKAFAVEDVFHEFAPFFTEQVRRDIVSRYGNERMLKDGLKVYMSMNAESQRGAQFAMLDGLIRVDKRQGFTGPLAHLEEGSAKVALEKKIAKKLGDERLTVGHYYVGLVEKVHDSANYAEVNVGGQMAKLPIAGMRWAREPNPERHYPSALIDHVKKALRPGDVIVVRAVDKATVEDDEEPRFKKLIPDEGPYVTLEQEPSLQGAIISVDPHRRYVVAMIGGYDFDASEYNRAFQACRQPGSSFKPIVYSGAIEILNWAVNHVLVDSPVVFDDPENQLRWKPENFGEDFRGDVLLRSAVINSMNIPAVKTLEALRQEIKMEGITDWAHKLGITTPLNQDLSMALGGSCVHLSDMVNVYSTMNRGGIKARPYYVRRVEDRFGRTLEEHTAYDDEFAGFEERVAAGYAKLLEKPERVMKPETAFIITHLMREVVMHGTGAPAQRLGKPAAGKTGTTNDSFDTWFMGFTRDLVTGVWLGYDHYIHPLGRYETGGRASLPIWVDFMKSALADRPQKGFDTPPAGADIVWSYIDPESGKLAPPGAKRRVLAPFVRDTEPKESAPEPGGIDPNDVRLME
ncbi:MAG: transglycosylase domain-containing protein [Deltaproteobacteria bacterium]|nr:transglycosylase domain-containing protein [Deltaproteobacteria bacterium]